MKSTGTYATAFGAIARTLPVGTAQLILLHIVHEFDCHGENGSVVLPDRELCSRSRLSKKTVTEGKRTLKNAGLIDYKALNNGTQYTLKFWSMAGSEIGHAAGSEIGHEAEKVGHLVGREVGREVGQGGSDLGHPVGQVQCVNPVFPVTPARAALSNDLYELHQCSFSKEEDEEEEEEERVRILKDWEYETGFRLSGTAAVELSELAAKDYETTRRAIIRAAQYNDRPRLRYAYFKAIYERLKEGAKRNGRSGKTERHSEPCDALEYPWEL